MACSGLTGPEQAAFDVYLAKLLRVIFSSRPNPARIGWSRCETSLLIGASARLPRLLALNLNRAGEMHVLEDGTLSCRCASVTRRGDDLVLIADGSTATRTASLQPVAGRCREPNSCPYCIIGDFVTLETIEFVLELRALVPLAARSLPFSHPVATASPPALHQRVHVAPSVSGSAIAGLGVHARVYYVRAACRPGRTCCLAIARPFGIKTQ